MSTEEYRKAGKIAAEVREDARKRNHVGRTLYEICEQVEGMIRMKGAEPAFPCNTSLNEIAAHYTAEPNDQTTVKDGDVLKIDIGVHVNGYIADTAVTTCFNVNYEQLVSATELALQEALKITKAGTKASDIGRAVENTAKRMGFKPIHNLSGHSLAQYTIHAGRSIPNIWTVGSFSLKQGEAYAIEPFLTMKDGAGIVRDGRVKNIFAIVSRKRTGDSKADALLDSIWKRFRTLPFALRWLLKDYDEKEARNLLELLTEKKLVRAYPVLVEASSKFVAQAEHSLIPTENGIIIITQA